MPAAPASTIISARIVLGSNVAGFDIRTIISKMRAQIRVEGVGQSRTPPTRAQPDGPCRFLTRPGDGARLPLGVDIIRNGREVVRGASLQFDRLQFFCVTK